MKGITKMGIHEDKKDEYFKIDVEAHLSGDKTHISYYPGVQLWWQGADGARRAFGAAQAERSPKSERRKSSRHRKRIGS